MLLSLAFLMPAFYYIPKASLAAVIICAVAPMVDYRVVVNMWRIRSRCWLSFKLQCLTCICLMLKSGAGVVHRAGSAAIHGDVPDEFLAGAVRHHRWCGCIWSPAAVQHSQTPDKGTFINIYRTAREQVCGTSAVKHTTSSPSKTALLIFFCLKRQQ